LSTLQDDRRDQLAYHGVDVRLLEWKGQHTDFLLYERGRVLHDAPDARLRSAAMRAETRFGDRYRLISEIGRGGMGVVWRAHDERLRRDVALKVLHAWIAEDDADRARFEREAQVLAQLGHPHIVRLYDYQAH